MIPRHTILFLAFTAICHAQVTIGEISTIYTGGSSSLPGGIAVDAGGNVYIADRGLGVVRKIDLSGTATIVAGGGNGGDGVLATQAALSAPCDVAVDAAGNLFISDSCVVASGGGSPVAAYQSRVRRVSAATGIITTVAGSAAASGFAGDGGQATAALLNAPAGIAVDASGNLFIADSLNNRIRRVDAATGIISTVVGTGAAAFSGDGGPAISAALNGPSGVAVDTSGRLCIADTGNSRIRLVSTSGTITTLAGTGITSYNGEGNAAAATNLSRPVLLKFNAAGNLIFSDAQANRVRIIDASGKIWTIAGNGFAGPGNDGVLATRTETASPIGVAYSSFGMFITESSTKRVRKITVPGTGTPVGVAVTTGQPRFAPNTPFAITVSLTTPAGAAPSATGAVNVYDTDGANITGVAGFGMFAGGSTLAIQIPGRPAGTYQLIAYYGGDSVHGGNSSAVFPVTVSATVPVVDLFVSPAVPVAGEAVSLTSTVSGSLGAATGTVTFFDGAVNLGTAPLTSGGMFPQAQLIVPGFAAGNHSLTARYNGDGTYDWASTIPYGLTVRTATTAALASNANPSNVGQAVTFTAIISPATATGTVQFLDGAAVVGSATVAGGTASFATASLAAGAHSITAVYSGDANHGGSTSPAVSQNVRQTTTTAIASNSNPSTAGQPVTFTATVSPAAATGSVQFWNGAVLLGTASLSGGTAALVTSSLAAGTSAVHAQYAGNTAYAGSVSTAISQTVVKSASSITLASSLNPSITGQTVRFTATVTPSTATGTVQFFDGAVALGTETVSGGVAILDAAALPSGTRSITAVYSGNTLLTGSTSPTLTQTVKVATTLSLTSSKNPARRNENIVFTATVSPSSTGQVQFFRGTTLMATVNLNASSIATYTWRATEGAHTISAVYGGSSTRGNSSATITQVVNR